jgi:mannose-6-phosphate isomerase-like protein (cupin superfamily)
MTSAKTLSDSYDVLAPDGSEVRILANNTRGSMAHFKLHPGQVSQAVAHRTVEELWYITAGEGQMWIEHEGAETIIPLKAGVSFSIPLRAHFQFRCDSASSLEAIGTTMPPWPGMDEAYAVKGKW